MIISIAVGIAAISTACDGAVDPAVADVAFDVANVSEITFSDPVFTTSVNGTINLSATAKDDRGRPMRGASFQWTSSDTLVAQVDKTGKVTGKSPGQAQVTATAGKKSGSTTVSVSPTPTTSIPPSEIPAAAEFILGPQVRAGSADNPWPWFDQVQLEKALLHGQAFPASQSGDPDQYYLQHYYDLTLVLYNTHARTGDTRYLDLARKTADSWAASEWLRHFANDYVSPRAAGLSGLMLRAMDGRPDLWPGITQLAREQHFVWLERVENHQTLHEGVRDGGFALIHIAQLARVHPDAAVRAEFQEKALRTAKNYYARLQAPDGGWYWDVSDGKGHTTAQPFMVGMLLEGLVAVHQLTGDPVVGSMILRAVDWLWEKGYQQNEPSNLPGVRWRAMRYFVLNDGRIANHGGDNNSAEAYGIADAGIRDARQLNPITLHAFGYAYRITGDPKYRQRGDEIFAATFGNGQGPGSDKYSGLADYRAREFNQSYRSAGRYLAWRQ